MYCLAILILSTADEEGSITRKLPYLLLMYIHYWCEITFIHYSFLRVCPVPLLLVSFPPYSLSPSPPSPTSIYLKDLKSLGLDRISYMLHTSTISAHERVFVSSQISVPALTIPFDSSPPQLHQHTITISAHVWRPGKSR